MAFERQWEEFRFGPEVNRDGDGLHVTLSRKGEIMIGAKAFERLGRPAAAVLLFDKRNHGVGISPTNADAVNGYPMIAKKGARHRIIRANMFCRHNGIYVPRTAAFGTAHIDGDGILVLDLRSLIGVGRTKAMIV